MLISLIQNFRNSSSSFNYGNKESDLLISKEHKCICEESQKNNPIKNKVSLF